MTLAQLSKPQSDAAHEAARRLMQGSIDREADRANYRAAVANLTALLPEGSNVADVVYQAARFQMLNDIGAMVSGLPVECAA